MNSSKHECFDTDWLMMECRHALTWKLSWPLLWLWNPPKNIGNAYCPMYTFLLGINLLYFSFLYSPDAILAFLILAWSMHAVCLPQKSSYKETKSDLVSHCERSIFCSVRLSISLLALNFLFMPTWFVPMILRLFRDNYTDFSLRSQTITLRPYLIQKLRLHSLFFNLLYYSNTLTRLVHGSVHHRKLNLTELENSSLQGRSVIIPIRKQCCVNWFKQ